MPRPGTSETEVRVERKTALALEQEGSIRCLLGIKYNHRDRQSVPVIAWARRKAGKVSQNLLKGAGLNAETGNFTFVLNGIKLCKRGQHSYICFDLHLEKCSRESREMIDGSIQQPIHVITKAGDIFIARRAPKCDTTVTDFFKQFQKHDQMKRPFFYDIENPPLLRGGKGLERHPVKDSRKDINMRALRRAHMSVFFIVNFMFAKLQRQVEAQELLANDVEESVGTLVENAVEQVIERYMRHFETINNIDNDAKKDMEKSAEKRIKIFEMKLKHQLEARKVVEILKEEAEAKKNGKGDVDKYYNNGAEQDKD